MSEREREGESGRGRWRALERDSLRTEMDVSLIFLNLRRLPLPHMLYKKTHTRAHTHAHTHRQTQTHAQTLKFFVLLLSILLHKF